MMNEQDKQRIEFPNVPKDENRNWTEDYLHENGKYQNKCIECKELFFGHKRRVICKVCFNKPIDWHELAKKKPPIAHENWAWQGCWADGEMTGYAKCMVEKVMPLTAELERSEKLLQEYKEVIRELLPIAEQMAKMPMQQYHFIKEFTRTEVEAAIQKAKSLLHQTK